jgi:UDP-N-acetylmuramate--alanine ligase
MVDHFWYISPIFTQIFNMHVFFSGIGGSGMSSLAHLALDAQFEVSGSDVYVNDNIRSLQARGATILQEQSYERLSQWHSHIPIYWLVYSSALSSDHPELRFARENELKISKREGLIQFLLQAHQQKLIAVAGTHGKTTTTAMLSWLCRQTETPVSYLIGSRPAWSRSGYFTEDSEYFILEADEYDRHFLNYQPELSLLTSIGYDHPDIYPTREEYYQAFREFLHKSQKVVAFREDLDTLQFTNWQELAKVWQLRRHWKGHSADYSIFHLPGQHNRQNAALVRKAGELMGFEEAQIPSILSDFPGTHRRLEKLQPGLYSDYAHHPTEIKATLQAAQEWAESVIVVYQPHQNARQKLVAEEYPKAFSGAHKVYWLPTFEARESHERIISAKELSKGLREYTILEIADLDEYLWQQVQKHIKAGEMVIVMGAGSIDQWFREKTSRK